MKPSKKAGSLLSSRVSITRPWDNLILGTCEVVHGGKSEVVISCSDEFQNPNDWKCREK